jgi:hypothetical protein
VWYSEEGIRCSSDSADKDAGGSPRLTVVHSVRHYYHSFLEAPVIEAVEKNYIYVTYRLRVTRNYLFYCRS